MGVQIFKLSSELTHFFCLLGVGLDKFLMFLLPDGDLTLKLLLVLTLAIPISTLRLSILFPSSLSDHQLRSRCIQHRALTSTLFGKAPLLSWKACDALLLAPGGGDPSDEGETVLEELMLL